MANGMYTVLEEYDPTKEYGVNIQGKTCSLLSMMKKGDVFTPWNFLKGQQVKDKSNHNDSK